MRTSPTETLLSSSGINILHYAICIAIGGDENSQKGDGEELDDEDFGPEDDRGAGDPDMDSVRSGSAGLVPGPGSGHIPGSGRAASHQPGTHPAHPANNDGL